MLSLVNRLLAGAPAAADVATPQLSGRVVVRYALGMALRLWGDGILNRAAELERERAYEQTDAAYKALAAARADLEAMKEELREKQQTSRLLDQEHERRKSQHRPACGDPECEHAPDGGNHPVVGP